MLSSYKTVFIYWWHEISFYRTMLRHLLTIFLFISTLVVVRAQDSVLDNCRIALKAGSAKELSKFFTRSIDIKIDGESKNYSKSQAEFVLRDFFRKHPATNFEFIHQGASRDGLKYAIGKYTHDQGSYRVYLLLKKEDTREVIDTIDFSTEE